MSSEGLVLQAARGDRPVGSCQVGAEPISIGSWAQATLPLDDEGLLPVHVVLDPEGDGRWRLIALAPDGVLVNGQPVRRGYVSPGDQLSVGPYAITVGAHAQTQQLRTGSGSTLGTRSTPAIPTGGRELAVRAILRWKGTPIEAKVVAPGDVLTVGTRAGCSFVLPPNLLADKTERWAALALLDKSWHVALDTPLRALDATSGFERPLLSTSPKTEGPKVPRGVVPGKVWAALPAGGRVRLDAGDLDIVLERVPQFQVERRRRGIGWATPEGQRAIIAAMFLAFLLAILRNPPPAPFRPDEALIKRTEAIAKFAPKTPDKQLEEQIKKWKKLTDKKEEEQSAAKSKGEEGKAGKPDAPERQARRGGPASDKEIVKQHALLKALNSGATDELLSGGALSAANSIGHLDGPAVGDAAGSMGLGLKGKGTGGGGLSADTVGVGPVGTKGAGMAAMGAGKVKGGASSDLSIDEPARVDGGLDREVIRRVILSHRAQIRYCYEKQLSATPDLAGKVLVEFVIAADGSVSTSKVGEQTLSDPAVGSCIVSKIKTWTFPQPKGGGVVVVSYPFLFKPAGQGEK